VGETDVPGLQEDSSCRTGPALEGRAMPKNARGDLTGHGRGASLPTCKHGFGGGEDLGALGWVDPKVLVQKIKSFRDLS
jgi:hypothetical protein